MTSDRRPALHLVPARTVTLRLRLLGSIDLERDGVPVTTWRTRLVRELLCYLALHAEQTVRTEALVDELLPEADLERGLTALRPAVFHLRRLFEPARVLETVAGGYRFTPGAALWCDALELQRLLDGGTRPDLEAAVQLYRGPLAPGLDGEWVMALRAALDSRFLQAAQTLLREYASINAHDAAIRLASHAVRIDPLLEEFHLALLRHLVAAGQRTAARRHFDHYRRVVCEAIGQDPDPEAVRLAAYVSSS